MRKPLELVTWNKRLLASSGLCRLPSKPRKPLIQQLQSGSCAWRGQGRQELGDQSDGSCSPDPGAAQDVFPRNEEGLVGILHCGSA